MTTFAISNTSTGIYLGTYDADNERAALDAMARDAGYKDHAEAERVAPSGSDLSVWSLTSEGVKRWCAGPGGAEGLVEMRDVPRKIAEGLDLDHPDVLR